MTSRIIPGMRYADAPAAIAFLCAAFGFTRHVVHADPENSNLIHHAQLVLGDAMVMIGSERPDDTGRRFGFTTPEQAHGVTMSLYCVVADPDAHFSHARDAGAEVIEAPHDNEGYPGRGYTVRDPEGQVWSFGSYDPWS